MATNSPAPSPAYADANRDVVRRVVDRLAGTGLLVDPPTVDPAAACGEAEKVRDFLNMEIPNVRDAGPLDASFKRMRRSARDFVRGGGPDAATYRGDASYFDACLRAMRLTLADEVSALESGYLTT